MQESALLNERQKGFEQFFQELLDRAPSKFGPLEHFVEMQHHVRSARSDARHKQRMCDIEQLVAFLARSEQDEIKRAFDQAGLSAITREAFKRDLLNDILPRTLTDRLYNACAFIDVDAEVDKPDVDSKLQLHPMDLRCFMSCIALLRCGNRAPLQCAQFLFRLAGMTASPGNSINLAQLSALLGIIHGRGCEDMPAVQRVTQKVVELSGTAPSTLAALRSSESGAAPFEPPSLTLEQFAEELHASFSGDGGVHDETGGDRGTAEPCPWTGWFADLADMLCRKPAAALSSLSGVVEDRISKQAAEQAEKREVEAKLASLERGDWTMRDMQTLGERLEAIDALDESGKIVFAAIANASACQHEISAEMLQRVFEAQKAEEEQEEQPAAAVHRDMSGGLNEPVSRRRSRSQLNAHLSSHVLMLARLLAGSCRGSEATHAKQCFYAFSTDGNYLCIHEREQMLHWYHNDQIRAGKTCEAGAVLQDEEISLSVSVGQPKNLTIQEFAALDSHLSVISRFNHTMTHLAYVVLGLCPATPKMEGDLLRPLYHSYRTSLNKGILREGEQWNLLGRRWWLTWCEHAHFYPPSVQSLSRLSAKRPFAINDNQLTTTQGELKSGVRLYDHVHPVPPMVWTALQAWYGGGPSIIRRVSRYHGILSLDLFQREDKSSKRVETEEEIGEPLLSEPRQTPKHHWRYYKDALIDIFAEHNADRISDVDKLLRQFAGHEDAFLDKVRQKYVLVDKLNTESSAPGLNGLVGLANLGNTCYMNSVLQCLSHTDLLKQYFTTGAWKHDLNTSSALGTGGKLAAVYAQLICKLWLTNQPQLRPREFKRAIGRFQEMFRGYQQQDAHEMLSFLLDGLSEDLNRICDKPYVEQPDSDGNTDPVLADEWWRNHLRREESVIVALFAGQFKSLLKCTQCGFASARFDPFTFLQLPLECASDQEVPLLFTAVFADAQPSLRCSILVRQDDTVADMKVKIANVLSQPCSSQKHLNPRGSIFDAAIASSAIQVQAQDLAVAALRSGTLISRLMKDDELAVDILQLQFGQIAVYVLAPDTLQCTAAKEQVKVRLVQRRVVRRYRALFNPFGLELFGTPQLIKLHRNCTPRELYHVVQQRIAAWTAAVHTFAGIFNRSANKDSNNTETLTPVALSADVAGGTVEGVALAGTFLLRRVSDGGMSCSRKPWLRHWLACPFGMPLNPESDEPLALDDDETVALDWGLVQEEIYERFSGNQSLPHSSLEENEEKRGKQLTLQSCLAAFTQEEKLDEMYCSRCQMHGPGSKRMDLWRVPPVMVIQLKRFQYTQSSRRKLRSFVDFPLHGLDLSPFLQHTPGGGAQYFEPYPSAQPGTGNVRHAGGEAEHEETCKAVCRDAAAYAGNASNSADAADTAGEGDMDDMGGAGIVCNATSAGDVHSYAGATDDAGDNAGNVGDEDEAVCAKPLLSEAHTSLHPGVPPKPIYDLFAVTNHFGVMGGGHYTAFACSEGKWYQFDDHDVKEVTEKDVVTHNAYLLFYVRSDMHRTSISELFPEADTTSSQIGAAMDEELREMVNSSKRGSCAVM